MQANTSVIRKIYGRSADLRSCKCSWASQEKFHNSLGLKAFRLWRHGRQNDSGTKHFFSQFVNTELVSD
jgi:hypothetical protein